MAGLTAIKVKTAEPVRHGDRQGLYLFVKPGAARSYVLRIHQGGKRRDFGLGSVPIVSRVYQASDQPLCS
jgi:hypothetical protein